MNLKCLIVDDEPPALDILESYIDAIASLELVGRCENAIQAFDVLQRKKIDLMFLDIKMPQLLGTDFVRSLKNPPPVIFTTAYRDYALEGFELDVIDYLLKPIPFERFLRAVGKVTNRVAIPLDPYFQTPVYESNKDAFIYFRTDRKAVKVFLREILYIESLKDYIRVVTDSNSSLIVKQSIAGLLDQLPSDQFVRIHRSFIISIAHVKAYTAQIVEVAGQQLPIGGLYQKDVQRALLISK